jgi:hypothetical protein
MAPLFMVILTLAVLYWIAIRRWIRHWGATPSDRSRVMAGDSLIVNPTYSGTMAVTVDAAAEDIFPWLVQIGHRRGGPYSYDSLDQLLGYLDRPSATRIFPEFQNLGVGDEIPVGRGPSWPVVVVEPGRALVLDMRNMDGFDWLWQFSFYRVDEQRTRLVSRSRVRANTIWARLVTYVIEPAAFLMTRECCSGSRSARRRCAPIAAEFPVIIMRHQLREARTLAGAFSTMTNTSGTDREG